LIPLPALGIDLLRTRGTPAIIEVNVEPAFAVHARPRYGTARDLAGALLDAVEPGRVPVVAASPPSRGKLHALARALARAGLHPCGYSQGHAWCGAPDRSLGEGPQAALLAALDPRAQVLLFEVDADLDRVGFPAPAIDLVLGAPGEPLDRIAAQLPSP